MIDTNRYEQLKTNIRYLNQAFGLYDRVVKCGEENLYMVPNGTIGTIKEADKDEFGQYLGIIWDNREFWYYRPALHTNSLINIFTDKPDELSSY